MCFVQVGGVQSCALTPEWRAMPKPQTISTKPRSEAIVKALASKGYEGWFVIEAEQDPRVSPPLEMALKGRAELKRVMDAAGYEVLP